jgi:hypothetical protein
MEEVRHGTAQTRGGEPTWAYCTLQEYITANLEKLGDDIIRFSFLAQLYRYSTFDFRHIHLQCRDCGCYTLLQL